MKKGDNSDNGNNKQWSYYDKQIIRKIKNHTMIKTSHKPVARCPEKNLFWWKLKKNWKNKEVRRNHYSYHQKSGKE